MLFHTSAPDALIPKDKDMAIVPIENMFFNVFNVHPRYMMKVYSELCKARKNGVTDVLVVRA